MSMSRRKLPRIRPKSRRIDEVWDRIEAWLAVKARAVAASLNPPASLNEIRRTERFLGVKLPEEFRATYLRHDGQDQNGPDIFEGWQWLSLEEIRRRWKGWKDVLDSGVFAAKRSDADGKKVRHDWWNPAWIPFTGEESDHLCLDLDPGPEGQRGQIIEMWHDEYVRRLIAPSFGDFLDEFVNDLESAKIVVRKDGDLFYRKRWR